MEVAGAPRKPWHGRPCCTPSSHSRQRPKPLASQKPASGLFRQLSRVLSLGLLRLGFLLGLGSQWEEQGQVPGKSAGMQGSLPAVRRGLSGLLPGIPTLSSPSRGLCRGWSWCGRRAGLGHPGELWSTGLGQGSDLLGSPGSGRKKVAFPEIHMRPTRGLAPWASSFQLTKSASLQPGKKEALVFAEQRAWPPNAAITGPRAQPSLAGNGFPHRGPR